MTDIIRVLVKLLVGGHSTMTLKFSLLFPIHSTNLIVSNHLILEARVASRASIHLGLLVIVCDVGCSISLFLFPVCSLIMSNLVEKQKKNLHAHLMVILCGGGRSSSSLSLPTRSLSVSNHFKLVEREKHLLEARDVTSLRLSWSWRWCMVAARRRHCHSRSESFPGSLHHDVDKEKKLT